MAVPSTSRTRPVSVFAGARDRVWPHRFEGTLFVDTIAGGIPSDEKVAEAWLRTKITDKDEIIREAVAKTMAERGISKEDAAEVVASLKHFTGFKHNEFGFYIDGRQLKAAIKEAAMVAVAAGKIPLRGWGVTSKYLKGFVAEHIMVVEDVLYLEKDAWLCDDDGIPVKRNPEALAVMEASEAYGGGIAQQFVHTNYGSAPHYKEYIKDAWIDFTVITDFDFTDEHWDQIWGTGEQQGIGASRSGGFGRYSVVRWNRVSKPPVRKSAKSTDSKKD